MSILGLLLLVTTVYASVEAVSNVSPAPNKYIVGGVPVNITDFAYQVSLNYHEVGHICGGSIINKYWILTAAHCVSWAHPSQILIRARSSYAESGGEVYKSDNIIIHPLYSQYSNRYDVGLIKVRIPISLGKPGIKAVKLADEEPDVNTLTTISGWGNLYEGAPQHSSELHAVQIPIVSRDYCSRALGLQITKDMICAGVPKGGKDSCQSDSGSPMVDPNGIQVGIVSWGRGCARPKSPGVYVNVAVVKDWINNVISIKSSDR